MSSSIFVEEPQAPQQPARESRWGTRMVDEENGNDYGFNKALGVGLGTQVPISRPNGGVEIEGPNGEKIVSPYGRVVAGRTITMDAAGQEITLKVFRPEALEARGGKGEKKAPKRRTRKPSAKGEVPVFISPPALPVPPSSTAETPSGDESVLGEVLKSAPSFRPESLAPSNLIGRAGPLANGVVEVEFAGPFGKFRGKYSSFAIHNRLVVLTTAADSVYSPPVSEEFFSLSCNGKTYSVLFFGIEFPLPGITVQVFLLPKE
jgi:hypothetical protein